MCLAAVGCSKLGAAPRLDFVEPADCSRDEACALVLRGYFEPPITAALDNPSRSTLGTFQVQLVSGDQLLELPPGAFRGMDRVETTLPAGAPEGVYLVRLTDPWGRSTSLADALRVRAGIFVILPDDGTLSGIPLRSPPLANFAAESDYGSFVALYQFPVLFDSSASSDYQTATADLEVSWSFPGAAPPWTAWTTTKTQSHPDLSPGLETVALAVRDADDDIGYAERTLSVASRMQDICIVTTTSWVKDGATACSGEGNLGADGLLSIDEAVDVSNSLAGNQTIVLASPLALTGPSLPLDSMVQIVGTPGATIQRELIIGTSTVTLLGVELVGQGKITVPLGTTIHLVDSYVHDSPGIVSAGRVKVVRSRFENCAGACITVDGESSELSVSQSSFSNGGSGDGIDAVRCVQISNTYALDLLSNTFSGFATAIRIGAQCNHPTRIIHQTFHGNFIGLDYIGGSLHELRNNIFTGQSWSAVEGCSVSFAARRDHLLFANKSDGCLATDLETTLREHPGYVSAATGDFRLRFGSLALDRAADTGLDVNGAAPGFYQGARPDLGARETY
jgi:hypothetical protein